MSLTPEQREGLALMLEDLDQAWLETILVPAPEPQHHGHMVRVTISHNADWYSRFCDNHQKARTKPRPSYKSDTKIVRSSLIKVLARWFKTGDTKSTYKAELLAIAEQRQTEEPWPPPQAEDDDVPF